MEKKKKILVIEDDLAICKLYIIALKASGLEGDEAHDGKIGLTKALHGEYDLILLDLMLPAMNGFDVLKVLKETETTSSIPVLVLTNLAGPEIEEAKKLGAADYLLKANFSPDQVVERVKSIIGT